MEMLDLALSANVSGVHDDHKLSNLFPFVGLVQYQYGFAVAIIPHVSYHGKGNSTILFSGHMKADKISSWVMEDSFLLLGNSDLKQWMDIPMLLLLLMKIGIMELFFFMTSYKHLHMA